MFFTTFFVLHLATISNLISIAVLHLPCNSVLILGSPGLLQRPRPWGRCRVDLPLTQQPAWVRRSRGTPTPAPDDRGGIPSEGEGGDIIQGEEDKKLTELETEQRDQKKRTDNKTQTSTTGRGGRENIVHTCTLPKTSCEMFCQLVPSDLSGKLSWKRPNTAGGSQFSSVPLICCPTKSPGPVVNALFIATRTELSSPTTTFIPCARKSSPSASPASSILRCKQRLRTKSRLYPLPACFLRGSKTRPSTCCEACLLLADVSPGRVPTKCARRACWTTGLRCLWWFTDKRHWICQLPLPFRGQFFILSSDTTVSLKKIQICGACTLSSCETNVTLYAE